MLRIRNTLNDLTLYLEHGLLVFTVFHLCCGEIEDAPLHRVLVAVVDEDVGPTHDYEVFHPRVGARLHEAEETFLGNYRSKKGGKKRLVKKLFVFFREFRCLFCCRRKLPVENTRVQKSIHVISAWTGKQDYLFVFAL